MFNSHQKNVKSKSRRYFFTCTAAKSLQSCPTLCDPKDPTRLPCPWDSPGKNTGVGCHFLLQCKKVKSESEVAESCSTLSDPMDCSPPGSSIHGIFQARVLEWGAIAFSVTCTRKAIIKKKKKTDNNKYWQGCGEIGTFTSGGNVKSFSCFEKQSGSSSKS